VRRAAFRHTAPASQRLADERGVPPYIVFSDVSLRQMARNYPSDERHFPASAVWAKRTARIGALFMDEIAAHLQANARQMFADDSFAEPAPAPVRSKLNDTARETVYFFRQENP